MKYTKNDINPRYTMFKLGFDYYLADTKEKQVELKEEFMQFLKGLDGWGDIPNEGGFVSSDGKTIIVYNRMPYEFQIFPFTAGGEDITEQRIDEFKKMNLI